MKLIKNPIFTFIIGLVIAGSIGVFAYSYQANRVGRVLTQPSHNTVRADPHTAFPNKQRIAPYARAVLQPFRYSTNLLLQGCSC